MEDEKKKIFLYMFVVGIMDLVFFTISGQFWYMIFIVISMVIGYFALYPNEFFLILNDAKKHAQNYLRNYKTKHAVEDNHIIENQRDIPEGCEEKRDFKKVDENNNKRNNIPFVN
ncbi:hypothetical protein [Methanothermococcus thermolithotrophicus]|jgi:hypothetical protein|uniref:hypothetical protein n=1 Tax=Methanothermococcus thermolithotrophicus TaxID=2186 RepID=UPI0003685E57|nr:hypothetical protein [Methanothermococcus thermolithotrophicus]